MQEDEETVEQDYLPQSLFPNPVLLVLWRDNGGRGVQK